MSSESNGVADWLCPLCQQGQTDRTLLSLHLTEQHSVLPSCVERLLDIVSMAAQFTQKCDRWSCLCFPPHRVHVQCDCIV